MEFVHKQPRTLLNSYQEGYAVLLTWVFILCQYTKERKKMIMMTLGPGTLMPNVLSALKVMKKLTETLVDRKLIDGNIIKDMQPFLFFLNIDPLWSDWFSFLSGFELANKDYCANTLHNTDRLRHLQGVCPHNKTSFWKFTISRHLILKTTT